MAAVLMSPETGLKPAAVPSTVFLHVAEGSAAKLLSAAFCRAMVLSVPSQCAARVRTTTGTTHEPRSPFSPIFPFKRHYSGFANCV
jgi:hypothetical protein